MSIVKNSFKAKLLNHNFIQKISLFVFLLVLLYPLSSQAGFETLGVSKGDEIEFTFERLTINSTSFSYHLQDSQGGGYANLRPNDKFIIKVETDGIVDASIQISMNKELISKNITNNLSKIGEYIIYTDWSDWKNNLTTNYDIDHLLIKTQAIDVPVYTKDIAITEDDTTFTFEADITTEAFRSPSTGDYLQSSEVHYEFTYEKTNGVLISTMEQRFEKSLDGSVYEFYLLIDRVFTNNGDNIGGETDDGVGISGSISIDGTSFSLVIYGTLFIAVYRLIGQRKIKNY